MKFHKKYLVLITLVLLSTALALAQTESKTTILGGGIAGAFQAYYAHQKALKKGMPARVTIYEKNQSIDDTTVSNIVASFTPDEILSVVPRGRELITKLEILFSRPGGVRVEDVPDVNNSTAASRFINHAQMYSRDIVGYQKRTQTLLSLGKMSMNLWQKIYDEADTELKAILIESNFNPCREPRLQGPMSLHDGYRIDLIYSVPNAKERALGMKRDYDALGYRNSRILSPADVMNIDPFLSDFVKSHSVLNDAGELQWKNDCVALWRPGGCIDGKVFLPKFYEYLRKHMGTYVDESGKIQDRFQLHLDAEVQGVKLESGDQGQTITGLRLANGDMIHDSSSYVFAPGEAVGTLSKFGLKEPSYARFAGASLMLNIPIPESKLKEYSKFNHCMEVHQEGVVLAWQARFRDGKIFIGAAGTKAFYGDRSPNKHQDFATNRNLLQLNMINDVLPEFVSLALGRDTNGQTLTQKDLDWLEQNHIAKRWVGTRAVAYDGFPTLGSVYSADGILINNAIVTTHLGSGGGSFSPAAVVVSRSSDVDDSLTRQVLEYAKSDRVAN